MAAKDMASGASAVRLMASHLDDEDFDVEASTVVMGVLSRLPDSAMPDDEKQALVRRIGLRFCVSKAVT